MSYNAELDLKYVESKLTYYIYMIGLNPDNLDTMTIDTLIEKARLFSLITSDTVQHRSYIKDRYADSNDQYLYKDEPAVAFLRNQRISIVANIRRFWYLRQLALGAMSRG
jgi:hypothetical protein